MAQQNSKKKGASGEASSSRKKKTAASAKPKAKAASSVNIKRKPVTEKEKKAAQKRHEHKELVKARDIMKRSQEREKAAYEASGIKVQPVAEDKRDIITKVIDYFKDIAGIETSLDRNSQEPTVYIGKESSEQETDKAPAKKGLFGGSKVKYDLPQTRQYKQLKNVYWCLLSIALLMILGTVLQTLDGNEKNPVWFVMLILGYATGIAAIILDFAKIKPLVKEHQKKSTKKKTPKQIKHEIEAVTSVRQPSKTPGVGKTGKK